MKKTGMLFSILMSILLLLPNYAGANTQDSPILTMEELAIQVMPEYSFHPKDKKKDKPSLLIGYHGTLMNQSGTPQKGKIEIPLPMKEKDFQIGYVAVFNRDQTEMKEIEYEVDKEKQTISWTTSEEIQPGELYKFVIEFYTKQIKAEKETKKLTYTFESFADIGMVRIMFLEPLKSDSFLLTPAAESHQENGYGMNMFMFQLQGMKVNEKKEMTVEYKRNETKTTMDIMNEMSNNTPVKEEEKNNEPISNTRIIWIVIAITSAIAILLLFLLKKRAKFQKPVILDDYIIPQSAVELETKKKDLRKRLIEGNISEDQYNELLRNLQN